jgi:hypothetical protein
MPRSNAAFNPKNCFLSPIKSQVFEICPTHEWLSVQLRDQQGRTMRAASAGINYKKRYDLGDDYESIKERATGLLTNYLADQGLFDFNNSERTVTFSTERPIPTAATNRPHVMLLFSNPHPHSVEQGMFLSPNTKGQENTFWPVMENAGWLRIPKEKRTPKQLAKICLNAEYDGPFELLFYCYYAFPTNYPEEIKKIFGKSYFKQYIELEARDEFRKTIQDSFCMQ